MDLPHDNSLTGKKPIQKLPQRSRLAPIGVQRRRCRRRDAVSAAALLRNDVYARSIELENWPYQPFVLDEKSLCCHLDPEIFRRNGNTVAS